jgi:GT2 family glycosyltransferase
VSFNCWNHLNECLASLYRYPLPEHETIVIDNASIDGTVERLKKKYPWVRLIENASNIGHVRAVNQGFDLANGEFIVLLDADTEMSNDAIKKMIEFLDKHPDISMVAPLTLNSDGTVQRTARNFPTALSGIFGRQSVLSKLFPNNPFTKKYLSLDTFSRSQPFRAEFISAACMLFRKVLLKQVGKWNQEFTGYWVDGDWCKRIQKKGLSIYCVPEAVIVHHEQNQGTRKKNPKRIIAFHRGVYKLYRLHYTYGYWDPRCVIAGFLLTLRTAVLLFLNSLKANNSSQEDPLSIRTSEDVT